MMKIKKILVSQPKPASEKSPYYDIATKHNVEIVFRPMIKVEGLTAKEFRQQKINLADFTAVIFTSRTAVDNFFRLCEECRVSVPDTMRYFCTTEQIALYLQKYIVYRKRKIGHICVEVGDNVLDTGDDLGYQHAHQEMNNQIKQKGCDQNPQHAGPPMAFSSFLKF